MLRAEVEKRGNKDTNERKKILEKGKMERSNIVKVKRILSLTLVCSMFFSIPVMAQEREKQNSNVSEMAGSGYLESIELELEEPKELSSKQIKELFAEAGVQPHVTTPDACEPNDSFETAYPYNKVPMVNSEVTSNYDLFGLGMRYSNLHSEEDVDWFSINLTAGQRYFVDLRNVGKSNWYIELRYIRPDGSGYYYTTDPSEKPKFEKKSEKYFYFTAKDTGTYYIKIANGGDWSNEMSYFFYVGPDMQYFDIVDMPTNGRTQIYGDKYSTYTFDLRGAVPAKSEIISMSISDVFSQGNECYEVEKYMSAGGKTYYSESGGGSNIKYISGASLGQLWTIGAKCAYGKHFTYWSGRLNGSFKCLMAPYPGNEV